MSFALDVNTYLMCSLFNVDRNKLSTEYSGMTIEQIIEAEAQNGNKEAANFSNSVLSDPKKLIELFELKDPGNKYKILSNMNQEDLDNMLPYLNQEDLAQGLNFFNKDKLLSMVQQLPSGEVANYALQMLSPEKLMALMPEEQLNNVLLSKDISKSEELQAIKTLDPEILVQMYESATGSIPNGVETDNSTGKQQINAKEVYSDVAALPDEAFQGAMLAIPPENKQEIVAMLAQSNPLLYNAIDSQAYAQAIGEKESKQEMVLSAGALEQGSLVSMNEQLPKELTAVVLTQMETGKFAQALVANFSDVLKQVIAA